MFSETVIRGVDFRPALFCAPLAGITHSAFRRLVAEFGGCGAFFTEMLSGHSLFGEDPRRSPYLRRSSGERRLIYQLMVSDTHRLEEIIGRLSEIGADGLDINLACHAPLIRMRAAGSRLFDNLPVLAAVLETTRRCWPGLLTVKVRLGRAAPDWEARFAERMRLFEAAGVDAVILHPRFFEDKFKRRARHELLAWAASLTRLPLIANGDIRGAETVRGKPAWFGHVAAVMVGRMAVARPWVFAAWERPVAVDYADVWRRLFEYTCEDFPPGRALGRIKLFTEYYARNFQFGHALQVAVQNACTLESARERADEFFRASPAILPEPSLDGV